MKTGAAGGCAQGPFLLLKPRFSHSSQVVGRFNQAGNYLGKEDFEVNRNGFELHVRGKKEDPNSCARTLTRTAQPHAAKTHLQRRPLISASCSRCLCKYVCFSKQPTRGAAWFS